MNKNIILYLSFISGFCGIAYEVLYARLLSTLFGDIFFVGSAILITFLLGISIGSLISKKLINHLFLIEIIIGIYAFLTFFLVNGHYKEILKLISLYSLSDQLISPFIIFLFLLIPSVLVGTTIPIFSTLLNKNSNHKFSNSFNYVYIFYNVGAAISILFLEYFLVRNIGITLSIDIIGMLNILLGIAIFFLINMKNHFKIDSTLNLFKLFQGVYLQLFLLSIASAIYQLLYFKIINNIFGALNENFSLLLVSVFLGIGLGSYTAIKFKQKFSSYLRVGSILILIPFLLLLPFIYLWAFSQGTIGIEYGLSWPIKILMIILFSLIPFSFFGGAISYFVSNIKERDVELYGKTLFISSLGNSIGYALMIFVLHENLWDKLIILIPSLILVLTLFLDFKISIYKKIVTLILVLILSISIYNIWPEKELNSGFQEIYNLDHLIEMSNQIEDIKTFKRYDETVSIVYMQGNYTKLLHNGYYSLKLGEGDRASINEVFNGISSMSYNNKEQRKEALVIGLGGGITAGALSMVYDNVTVVEINPAMLEIIENYRKENFNLVDRKNVNIVIDDGINFISGDKKYDLIVNTIPNPTYFSASKLWTIETFELISENLNEGGIYSAWFDGRLGEDGGKIIAKTFESVFKDCNYLFYGPLYFNVVCSNEELNFRYHTDDEEFPLEIQQRMIERGFNDKDFSQTIADLTFVPSNDLSSLYGIEVNTLDKPVLEFVDLYNLYKSKAKYQEFIDFYLYSNFDVRPDDKIRMGREELKNKCITLRTLNKDFYHLRCAEFLD